jgi:hypothetical protein
MVHTKRENVWKSFTDNGLHILPGGEPPKDGQRQRLRTWKKKAWEFPILFGYWQSSNFCPIETKEIFSRAK